MLNKIDMTINDFSDVILFILKNSNTTERYFIPYYVMHAKIARGKIELNSMYTTFSLISPNKLSVME